MGGKKVGQFNGAVLNWRIGKEGRVWAAGGEVMGEEWEVDGGSGGGRGLGEWGGRGLGKGEPGDGTVRRWRRLGQQNRWGRSRVGGRRGGWASLITPSAPTDHSYLTGRRSHATLPG